MEFQTIAKLNRSKSIILTLFRYGFGDIVSRLDLQDKLLPTGSKKELYTQASTWRRIRLAMEELGPTFIKFGQLLSLRTDLIPEPLVQELSKLQDNVPPENFPSIKKQIESNLETDFDSIFMDFEQAPLAAASLAQVHRAVLKKDKQVVAIKVQRPGIQQTIRSDLNILDTLARKVHERIETLQVYNLPNLILELRRLLLRELDFEKEGRNIRLAQKNFTDNPNVIFPKVYTELTTPKILTMELIKGKKLRDCLDLPEEERKILARNGLKVSLQQILEHGFFHADPHPGNIFVLDKGKFSLLDWGMVGRLTPTTRFKLISLFEGIVTKDSERILEVLIALSIQPENLDKEGLHREILDILDDYHSLPLKEINFGQLLGAITSILQKYRIQLKSDLAIMIKATITSEGSARLLFPELDVFNEAAPFLSELTLQKYSPANLLKMFRQNLSHIWKMQKDMPGQVNSILGKLETGNLSLGFEHKRLEGMRLTLERVANRLTLGVITAAMIIGSSMIITTGVDPLIFGYPALGLIGYLLSACVGAWLAIDIIRKKKL